MRLLEASNKNVDHKQRQYNKSKAFPFGHRWWREMGDSDMHFAEIKTFAQKQVGDVDPYSAMGQGKIKDYFALEPGLC